MCIYKYQAYDEQFLCSTHLVGDTHRQVKLYLRTCRIVISVHLAFVTNNPLQCLQQLQDKGVGEFPSSVHQEILPNKEKEQSNSVLLSKMKEQNKYRQTVEIITQPSRLLSSTKEQCNSKEYNCVRIYNPTTSIRTFTPRKFNIDPSVECVIDLIHKPFVLRGCVIDQMIDPSVELNVVPDSVQTFTTMIDPSVKTNVVPDSVPTFTPMIIPKIELNKITIPSINRMSLRIISRQSIQVGNKHQSNVVPDYVPTIDSSWKHNSYLLFLYNFSLSSVWMQR